MICNECELPSNNGLYTKDEIVKMYNICLEEIRKMDDDEYEAFC